MMKLWCLEDHGRPRPKTFTNNSTLIKKAKNKLKKKTLKEKFKKAFNKHIKLQIESNYITFLNSEEVDQEGIDAVHKSLSRMLLKAARCAEKDCDSIDIGKQKFKKIFNKTCHINKKYLEIK